MLTHTPHAHTFTHTHPHAHTFTHTPSHTHLRTHTLAATPQQQPTLLAMSTNFSTFLLKQYSLEDIGLSDSTDHVIFESVVTHQLIGCVERVAECLRRWTRDLGVWSSIPPVPVMFNSLGQALNPHRFCPPSSNGYQVEWKLAPASAVENDLHSSHRYKTVKVWIIIPGVSDIKSDEPSGISGLKINTFTFKFCQLHQWLNETDAVTFYRQGMSARPEELMHLCKFGHKSWSRNCSYLLDVVHTEEGLCYSIDPTKHFPNWTIEGPGSEAGIKMLLSLRSFLYGGHSDTQGVGFNVSKKSCVTYLSLVGLGAIWSTYWCWSTDIHQVTGPRYTLVNKKLSSTWRR